MKRLILIVLAAVLLVACGNKEKSVVVDGPEEEKVSENDEIETLSSEQIELALADNEDLKIDLLHVNNGRSELTDHVSLNIKIENKQNKTFELLLKDLTVDGKKVDSSHSWISDDEIKPNETIETIINGYEYEELTIAEHVSGTIIYKDYEGNRNEITFSSYIND